jgi:hypothetical protein
MNFHLGLSRDVYPKLKDNLCDQAARSPVVFSSRASRIILRICLHRQNGNLLIMAYKNCISQNIFQNIKKINS